MLFFLSEKKMRDPFNTPGFFESKVACISPYYHSKLLWFCVFVFILTFVCWNLVPTKQRIVTTFVS